MPNTDQNSVILSSRFLPIRIYPVFTQFDRQTARVTQFYFTQSIFCLIMQLQLAVKAYKIKISYTSKKY